MLTTTQPSKTVDWAVDSSVNKSASFREYGKIFALLRERISPFFDNYGGSFLVSWLNNSGTPPPPPIPNLSRYIKLGKQFPIFLQLCFFTFTGSLWRCGISRQKQWSFSFLYWCINFLFLWYQSSFHEDIFSHDISYVSWITSSPSSSINGFPRFWSWTSTWSLKCSWKRSGGGVCSHFFVFPLKLNALRVPLLCGLPLVQKPSTCGVFIFSDTDCTS